jgi:hypothetical protein
VIEREALERIRDAMPEDWQVGHHAMAAVQDEEGDYMQWLVVFERTIEVAGPATYGINLRTFEVSAMGRTVTDIIRVAESLSAVEVTLAYPWPIDLEIKSDIS